MGPISSAFSRLYGAKGWAALGAVAGVLFLVFPLLNLVVPASSPFHVSAYWVTLIGKIMCYAIVALAMDLIWGYAGILSLGHGLFFALGGYAFGMYLMREIGADGQYRVSMPDFMVFLDWKEFPWQWWSSDSFWWCALLVVLVPGLLAFVFGYFAFRSRVKGVYFSIITQALTYAAIRDAEQRVMFCGYNTAHYKLFVWTLSAVLCGIAGALYVPQVGIINPSEMSPANSIEIAIWVAVGGRGTLVGAIVGAGIVNGAKSFLTQAFPEVWLYFLGLLFILVTLFLPQGVVGVLGQIRDKLRVRKLARTRPAEAL